MHLAQLKAAARESGLRSLITVHEASRFARVHPNTIRRWIGSKRLQAVKSAPCKQGRVLIPRDALLSLLAKSPSK